MPTLNIPARQLVANEEGATASRSITSRIKSARVQLIDPGGQWPATPDNTRHLKVWGLQIDRGDGVGWLWWLFQGDPHDSAFLVNGETVKRVANSALWLPFGSRQRDGTLPDLMVGGTNFVGEIGNDVRLAAISDADVQLGATVIVN